MPRITLVSPFAKFHGKSSAPGEPGGQVLYSVGAALYSRRLVDPANPDTTHQSTIRSLLATGANGYQALTDVQAAAWRTAASGLTRKNIFGQIYAWTGMSLYMSVNTYRQMDGEALTATPPATDSPGAILGVTSATVNGANLDVVITHSMDVGDLVYCRVSEDLGSASRQGRPNDLKTLTTDFDDSIIVRSASPQTLAIPMEYFTVTAAEHIAIHLLPLTSVYYPGTDWLEANVLVLPTS